MDRERWQRIEEIFHAALERTAENRAAFVEQACGGDTTLRDEVTSLLRHDDCEASFMETPALAAIGGDRVQTSGNGAERDTAEATLLSDTPLGTPHVEGELPAGHLIENYRIVRKIGAGGMGDVYLAEDLQLGRRVALKLLPPSIHADGKSGRRFLREARAASALNHPSIVTIHSVKEAEGQSFIEMEFIEGESLRERLLRGPLEPVEVIALGLEAADAASAAHAINIVHRDLKPGNILLTPSGAAKIVDFGLAKMAGAAGRGGAADVGELPTGLSSFSLSQAGSVSGTVPYMSPEQTRGEHVDARSDIFSLGCVLYEAATGRRPFDGENPVEIIQKIRDVDPPRPSAVRHGLPRGLDRILNRALSRGQQRRYTSMDELAADLRRLRTRLAVRRFVRRAWVPATVAALVVAVAASWLFWRRANIAWARDNLPRMRALVDEERYFEAYDLGQRIARYAPDDPALAELMPWATDVLSVTTEPPGAGVYLRRYQRDESGEFPPREFIGSTPIQDLEIARGDYVLSIEKEGFVPFRRTISSRLKRLQNGPLVPGTMRYAELVQTPSGSWDIKGDSDAPIIVSVRLLEPSTVPERMVFVPGGNYQLHGSFRPTEESVRLDDFFIDQFEVTNREYREFVTAGGYADRRFWKHPFVQFDHTHDRRGSPDPADEADRRSHDQTGRPAVGAADGAGDPSTTETPRELSWEDGIALLIDRTGKPGPRGWTDQQYPAGMDDHPVTGVTWYEAAAYAEFRGKRLPTVFQWEKASRDETTTLTWWLTMPWGVIDRYDDISDRANLAAQGTMPVGSFEFGLSPCGCHDMAGNVWEWCLNLRPGGFTTAGGSWREGANLFSSWGQFPGFYASETLGFRCVLNKPGASGDQGALPLPDKDEVPVFEPVSEQEFELFRTHYDYDRPGPEDALASGRPLRELLLEDLDVRVIEEVETDDWRRVKISFIGAERQQRAYDFVRGDHRALAYLWLPKNSSPPYQLVNYKASGMSYAGMTASQDAELVCGPFIPGGRAVFVTVLEGMRERDVPPDFEWPDAASVAHRQMMIYDTLDQRRALDYLETRGDIDMDRIVCMGLSMGGYDIVTMAVEERFKGVLLLAAGLGAQARNTIPAANPINFAPYIRGPKLMIHGRYDEGILFRTRAQPLFDLLSEPKELVVLESGHFPPMDQWVPHALRFLDATLGPVETTENSTEVAQGRE